MNGKASILFALWLFQVVNYMDRVVIGFAGPSIMKNLSLDPKTFGLILSSFSFGYLLSQVPGGLIADRWGGRMALIVAPLFWGLFTGLAGFCTSAGAFIFVRLSMGAAEGLSNSSIYKVVADNFDSRARARAVAVFVTAFAIGPAVTGPLVGFLLSSFGWQSVFLILVIPSVIAALVNYAYIPSGNPTRVEDTFSTAPTPPTPLKELIRQRSLWIAAISYALWNIAFWGLLGWMPSYLALERHVDIKASGLLGGIPYALGVIGILFSGWLGGGPCLRYRSHLYAGMCACAAVFLYIAYVSETLSFAVLGLSGAAFCIYGGLSAYGAVILDLAPADARAAYAAIASTVGQIGAVAAPIIIGYMVEKTGTFSGGFGLMIVALIFGAVCALTLPRPSSTKAQLNVVLASESNA
jgi:sugar phosphate permease